jgi:hypothetical protein
LDFAGIGRIIAPRIDASSNVKNPASRTMNPILSLALIVLAGVLGFIVGLVASAEAVRLVGGLLGIALWIYVGLPFAILLSALSFFLVWKKLNP